MRISVTVIKDGDIKSGKFRTIQEAQDFLAEQQTPEETRQRLLAAQEDLQENLKDQHMSFSGLK